MSIYNIHGQMVTAETKYMMNNGNNIINLDITGIEPGVYNMVFKSDQIIKSKKIVITK